MIQLEVVKVERSDVHCTVIVGGELRSRKGLNLPGIDLGVSAFTDHDRHCLEFALEHGVDAVSQSFVESASDIRAVREASAAMGYDPFIIAKIERSRAMSEIEGILEEADGIMVARGDLGVEIPIEQISVMQKRLVRRANLLGKPMIIATQMLESMVEHRRPTRAESTDVANAILDGTDCVMLSAESAVGKYPVEAVAMLVKIATVTESYRLADPVEKAVRSDDLVQDGNLRNLIAFSVEAAVKRASPAAIMVPTRSGDSARSIARFRLPVWITAVSPQESTCRRLQLSYGVYPAHEGDHPDDWRVFAMDWLQAHAIKGNIVLLIEGPSPEHSDANHRMEIIDLRKD